MTQRLWIPGPLPGMNEIIAAAKGAGGTGRAYARMKREWTDVVALLAKAAKLRPVERVAMRFMWREPSRRRDKDNVASARKFVLDGLVLAKVLSGDGWEHVDGWTDAFEVGPRPGVTVELDAV